MASDDPIHEDAARPKQGPASAASGDAAKHASEPDTPAASASEPGPEEVFREPAPTQAASANSKQESVATKISGAASDDVVEPDAYEVAAASELPPVLATRPSPWGAVLSGAIAGAVVAVVAAWTLTQYAPAPGQSGANARLDALEARLSTDRTTKAQRITQMETALKQIAQPDLQPISAAITQLRGSGSRTEADLSTLRTQMQGLQTSLQGGVDGAKMQAADLARRLDETQKRIDEAATAAQAMDRAAAAVAILAVLRDAVISGRPFATELDAARAILGPSAGSFNPFMAAANQGYAPPAKLATRLAELGAAALDAQPEAPKSGGLVNRLISSAEGLVRVTPPSAAAAGPESAAQLQTAVAAVRAGDLDAALAALATLPGPVKEKLQPVITEIEGRRDAANAASALFQQALAAISGKVP